MYSEQMDRFVLCKREGERQRRGEADQDSPLNERRGHDFRHRYSHFHLTHRLYACPPSPYVEKGGGFLDKEVKQKLIETETLGLKRLFTGLDGKKQQLAYRLCAKAAYLKVSLEEMQEDIDRNGYYEKFSQGKDQEPYDRRRPVVDTYNSYTSSYQKYMKQLAEMMPKKVEQEKGDGFEDFVNGRED